MEQALVIHNEWTEDTAEAQPTKEFPRRWREARLRVDICGSFLHPKALRTVGW